jgi:triacylglycerol lipase
MFGALTATLGFGRSTDDGTPRAPHAAEAMATLREAVLLARDLAPVVPRVGAGEDVVVLLHGFMASAGVFRPMRARLEGAGIHVASFTHAPGAGVRRIAAQLALLVGRIHQAARVHLVGHSLGGVVARWYVQQMGGDLRVAQTISLASPFYGAPVARRLRVLVGADLHGESELLARVRAGADHVSVPHTSIIGGADRMVQPLDSAPGVGTTCCCSTKR